MKPLELEMLKLRTSGDGQTIGDNAVFPQMKGSPYVFQKQSRHKPYQEMGDRQQLNTRKEWVDEVWSPTFARML